MSHLLLDHAAHRSVTADRRSVGTQVALIEDLPGFVVQVVGSDQRTVSQFGRADIFVEVLSQLRVQVSHHRRTSKPPLWTGLTLMVC